MSRNILLIGFMGSGKTTIAKKLKKMSGMEIIDMDREIAGREGMSIPEVFERYGETYFRDKETALLIELQARDNLIISCGGGIVVRDENFAEMHKAGIVVLLTASAATTYRRVCNNNNRPLLNGNMNVAYIQELMNQRKPLYEKAAKIVVKTDRKRVQDICAEILERVQNV
ncbi:MAG: shikimate kinase [Eubacteriales bacterium]